MPSRRWPTRVKIEAPIVINATPTIIIQIKAADGPVEAKDGGPAAAVELEEAAGATDAGVALDETDGGLEDGAAFDEVAGDVAPADDAGVGVPVAAVAGVGVPVAVGGDVGEVETGLAGDVGTGAGVDGAGGDAGT